MNPIVRMENITKRFPGVTALDNISFDILPGEVHILLGENGAGKSTLMKILSGAYEPDEGKIFINGKEHSKLTPKESKDSGISIIYQELSVINELSIQENIFLGNLIKKKSMGVKVIDNAAMCTKTQELLKNIDLQKDPTDLVGGLNISEKQMVEIAKSVAFNSQVIVMDEPTSSLTEEEIEHLFKIIEKLKSEGKGVVYISHKLKEIMRIGDRVSVLKDGTYVGTHFIKDVTIDQLVTMMVGREVKERFQSNCEFENNEIIFEAKGLTDKVGFINNVSFTLHKGEVLGFSGLIGAGRSETMSLIYGATPKKSGEVVLNGEFLEIKNPYDALKKGIGLVTENRRETGFFHNFSIKRNISIAKQLENTKLGGLWGLIDFKDENKTAHEQQIKMQIKAASLEQSITQLSGGNQQKVILGKWLAADVKLLILDEPTKGIDVGTKSEIYKLIRQLAKEGIGVIVVSSELPELLAVTDRIIVMNTGKITADIKTKDATEELLVRAATIEVEG